MNDNWQSGSQYNIAATSAIIEGADIYPVFRSDNTTFINWLPILQRSVGNDMRTYSAYANDTWRYNNRLSFNVGVRFDLNRSKDQSGTPVVRDSQWSPRLGATWDISGDGQVGYQRRVRSLCHGDQHGTRRCGLGRRTSGQLQLVLPGPCDQHGQRTAF